MKCNFVVGQKVVCVNKADMGPSGLTRAEAIRMGASYPELGRTYTVREIYVSVTGIPALLLQELDNSVLCSCLSLGRECGFSASWFRPLVERKTDISIFTAMLTEQKQVVNA